MKVNLIIPGVTVDELLAAQKFFGRFNTKLPEEDCTQLQSFLQKFEDGINRTKKKFNLLPPIKIIEKEVEK